MKIVTFIGIEDQQRNLQNAIEQTDNNLPEVVEIKVYVVDIHSLFSTPHWEVTESKFIELAKSQGTVYTLEDFQKEYNIGKFDEPHFVIRFVYGKAI